MPQEDELSVRLAAARQALSVLPRALFPAGVGEPAAWLLDHLALLPCGGKVLDVACGRGRHALLLAGAGFSVTAVDRSAAAVDGVRAAAHQLGLELTCRVLDLETSPAPDLGAAGYDAVLVFNYLHRPLFPALRDAVAPGGHLLYETFTVAQASRGRPRNPAFLLQNGELAQLMAPLTVLHSREGEFDGRCLASVVARRRE
jgi:SAM-dependent methyltransferase